LQELYRETSSDEEVLSWVRPESAWNATAAYSEERPSDARCCVQACSKLVSKWVTSFRIVCPDNSYLHLT